MSDRMSSWLNWMASLLLIGSIVVIAAGGLIFIWVSQSLGGRITATGFIVAFAAIVLGLGSAAPTPPAPGRE